MVDKNTSVCLTVYSISVDILLHIYLPPSQCDYQWQWLLHKWYNINSSEQRHSGYASQQKENTLIKWHKTQKL